MFLENFAGNPLENILVNLSFFHVVQNFVTTVVVKLYRYILHSGFTKSFSAFSDAFSIVSDGVLRSGYKKEPAVFCPYAPGFPVFDSSGFPEAYPDPVRPSRKNRTTDLPRKRRSRNDRCKSSRRESGDLPRVYCSCRK